MQSADLRLGDHIAHLGWLYWPRIRAVSIQRAMCSRSVVVGRVAIKHSEKVPFIAHDDVVEAVSADRSDQAFTEWIRLRRNPPEPEARYRRGSAQKYTRYRNLTSRPGTSFSAPLVAGIGALVDGTSGGRFGPQQIATILAQTADDLGAPGVDLYYSHGRVNAARAVAQR